MAVRKRSPLHIPVTEPHQCSVDVRLRILGQAPFFRGLPSAALEQINAQFHEKGFLPGETVCAAGDPAEQLFIIADGRVRLLRHSPAGKDILLDLLAPGEFFGSLSTSPGDVYLETAQAQTAACILTIGRQAFRGILDQHPPVALKVLDVMTARLQASNERIQQLSVLPVEGRIASVLLRLAEKFGAPGKGGTLIQAPVTRPELAAMTGATTESASRVMSQFQKSGLIQSGRGWVAILNPEALKHFLQ